MLLQRHMYTAHHVQCVFAPITLFAEGPAQTVGWTLVKATGGPFHPLKLDASFLLRFEQKRRTHDGAHADT